MTAREAAQYVERHPWATTTPARTDFGEQVGECELCSEPIFATPFDASSDDGVHTRSGTFCTTCYPSSESWWEV